MHRKSIGSEFFSSVSAVLVCGLLLMCAIVSAMMAGFFAREKQTSLTAILDGAMALSERYAAQGSIVTGPMLDAVREQDVREGFEVFDTASGAIIFVADKDGHILLNTYDAPKNEACIPVEVLARLDEGRDVFETNTLGGVFDEPYYTAGRRVEMGGVYGYLFAASPARDMLLYLEKVVSMLAIAALGILLVCGVLSMLLTRRITSPVQDISAAARRLGTGDFTARAPVAGCAELADLATTFNTMAARLQTIDNSRGQFMGNIAHELRTPMTSIKGFIDGMLDGTIPPEENQRYLTVVSQETGRLARLVQNMLDITKLEAGEVQVHAQHYDIWKTVTDVVLADEKRIEDGRIDIEGLDAPSQMIYADPDFIHQVVYNIVDNAIKFTPPGGVIRFKAEPAGDKKAGEMVRFSIENTGAGIAADALPFVFERFYKEDRSRGMNTRGSGLGLHICKVLIGLSGGEIHAESEEGQWCRFVFTLPVNGPA